MISVFIPTRNEEINLAQCLESLKWSDDIVVFDSYSEDSTIEIAKSFGARVIQRKFDDWASHLNWLHENVEFKYPWLYYSDADEVITEELQQELLQVVQDRHSTNVAYRLRYKNFFMGKWIKRCGVYPVWLLRLYQPSKVRWERLVNQTPVIDGTVGKLYSHFHHFSFRKGLHAWFEKHNNYSTGEAYEAIKSLKEGTIRWDKIFQTSNPAERRIELKELSLRFPCRSQLRFLYMYLFRFGFLDGVAGYHYCRLLAIYEYMIVLKQAELRNAEHATRSNVNEP
jgi:glycosyltransferase involved in cell wall biosynthesis